MTEGGMKMETILTPCAGGYRWFVVSEYNDHVLAQGYCKSFAVAARQVMETKAHFEYELNGVGV